MAAGDARPPLLLTRGEPAGIAGEITLKAWRGARAANLPPFAVLDDARHLAALAARLGLAVPVRPISAPEEASHVFASGLPVLDRPLSGPVEPGRPNAAHAPAVIAALDEATDLVAAGRGRALVTNPIHKKTLMAAGFTAPGHTEYLAARLAERRGGPVPHPVMMLVCPGLRVVPVTVHLSLAEAIRSLTVERIVQTGATTAEALRADFGIALPRLAVAALNPHAGEGGAFGREEIEIIAPACRALADRGIAVVGPLPADTLFHPAARARHDAVLCLYHDQALIPLKTIDFAGGVNVTLGLPIVRTSPDHGTAFDIAGQGRADETSLIHAIALAGEIAEARARRAIGA